MQRIRAIFNIAKFFNDRGGEGEERRADKYLEVGKLMRLSAMRYKKGELCPLPDPTCHNKPVDPNPEQFG